MPYKPESPALPMLPGYGVLDVRGEHAASFLQAQAMNDVTTLVDGRWHWSGWLTPKGRVIALFAVLRTAPDRFLLIVLDHPAAELADRLRRFVFRSRVVLDGSGAWRVASGPVDPGAAGSRAAGDDAAGWRLDFGTDAGARTLHVVRSPLADGSADADHAAAWHAADLAAGLPRLDAAQREAWTPQMLSLDRLGAYSLKKGCYPGQEIVARTHYLGQARRGLRRLAGDGLVAGDGIVADGRAVGTVACATADGREALAVLPTDLDASLRVHDRPVAIIPLNGGLSRVA